MAIDSVTVITSAAISAIVSGTVSLAIASWTAGRQERGRQRHNARRDVRMAVADALDATHTALLGIEIRYERSSEGLAHSYLLASRVVDAAEGLGLLRRLLVHRRLRQVVGDVAFDLGRNKPEGNVLVAERTLSAAITADRFEERYNPNRLGGLLHHAFTNMDRVELIKLRRQLNRIARCR